jgi:hypothetical protein
MKNTILILLLSILCCTATSAQDASGNRRKVIDVIMRHSNVKTNTTIFNHPASIYSITSAMQSTPQGFRTMSAIPKYCLAKGAVICRLEEYVQLHGPFKLNIGVGGE